MSRLYEWEAHLTERERHQMVRTERHLESARREVARLQSNRDAIRRKAVQRARNALLKAKRQSKKGQANAV